MIFYYLRTVWICLKVFAWKRLYYVFNVGEQLKLPGKFNPEFQKAPRLSVELKQ